MANVSNKIKQAASEQGRLGDLKKGRETAMLNARGMWRQQERKASTGEGTADHQVKAND